MRHHSRQTANTLCVMRTRLASAALAVFLPVAAQPAPQAVTRIDYPTVAVALQALEARDGNGSLVAHSDGWTIVNEPLASAQWSFTPAGHYAHPAVVRRVITRAADGAVAVETASLCEAPQPQCAQLLLEFNAMNERITQSVKARGRQGSTQPAR